MKTILSLFVILLFSNLTIAQTTAIPDANFEQVLIDLGLDVGIPDGAVLTANIDTVTSLNVSLRNISDLTGIEDFTALTELICSANQLTSLDVTQNTALTDFSFNNNQLMSLDVTQNTALTDLNCFDNLLTRLDVTQNTALITLKCDSNQLGCLNIKNGNNNNFTSFSALKNPSLTCVEVDNATWSTTNWNGSIDPAASFSTNCPTCLVGVNEYDISNVSIYPNPTQGTFTIETPNQEDYFIEVINITGKVIHKEQIKAGGIKQIDLGDYSKGIYLLKLTNNKETIVEKIVYK